MTQQINLIVGFLAGAIFSSMLVFVIAKSHYSKVVLQLKAESDQLRIELTSTNTQLNFEKEERKTQSLAWELEKSGYKNDLEKLTGDRLNASNAQARAEVSAINANDNRDALSAKLNETANLLQCSQLSNEQLKMRCNEESFKAEEAIKSRETTVADKQIAFDQLVVLERSSHTRSRDDLIQTHDAQYQQFKERLQSREVEHEKALSFLNESRDVTEKALREGYEKEIDSKQVQFDEIKTYLAKADEKLRSAFGDASTHALQKATESFFELAKSRFDERDEKAKTDAEVNIINIEKLLLPVKHELGELEKLNREIEKERAESFGSLKQTITNLNKSNDSLANALKKPSVRGSWGEGQLLSILESSGWIQGKNFNVQDVTEEDGKTLRTDVVINLPRGRKVIIDSKAPLDHYMSAMEAENDEERNRRCTNHARAVRGHMKSLEKKEYWTRYSESPNYIIMFLPYEAAYQIACEYDRALLDDSQRSHIILANPMTLMNLVHLATYVLNEERLQKNTDEVRQLGKQLCERLSKVLEFMTVHGRHIRIAADSYNDMVASVSSRLLLTATKMKELGSGSDKDLVPLTTVDTAIRSFSYPEFQIEDMAEVVELSVK